MKKTRVLSILFAIGFIGSLFTGCANGSSSDDKKDDKKKDTTETTEESNTPAAESRQGQLDAASAGATVTLDSSFADTELTVAKALTVDGNSISGLTVTVSSDVSSSVTLKNFKNAKIRVASLNNGGNSNVNKINYSASRIGYFNEGGNPAPAPEGEELDHFRKFGDDAVPLHLEGCTIDEFEAEADVTLYLEGDTKKTEIEDLYLRKGVEDFTFIEDDKNVSHSSEVGKLYIEDGLEEINLIGGSFDAVDFADDITNEIKFKYDEEFGQFDDALIAEIKARNDVEARDIALADNIPTEQNSGVYEFEMSRTEFEALNGHIDILFLTSEQRTGIQNRDPFQPETYLAYMTYDTPAYDMSIMGPFAVEKNSQGSFETGLNAVYGASRTFLDYAFTAHSFKITTLEKYLSYSKEAVVINIGSDKVTVLVNKNAIKKSDLLMCTGYPNLDEDGEPINGKAEGGTKLTDIDLQNYEPYLGINFEGEMHSISGPFGQLQYDPSQPKTKALTALDPSTSNFTTAIAEDITAPTGWSKQAIPRVYTLFPMEKSRTAYPDVSNVTYPDITISSNKVTVNYCNAAGTTTSTEQVLRENISPYDDDFEYYLDNQFKKIIYGSTTPEWEEIYEQYNIAEDAALTLYARPKRNITISNPEMDPYMGDEFCYLNFASNGVFIGGMPALVYGSYNASTKEYSDPITDPSTIEDNSTIYIKSPVVKFNASDGTNSEYLGTVKLVKILEVVIDILENPNSLMNDVEKSYYSKFYTTSALTTAYTSATLKLLSDGADVYSDGPKFMLQENKSNPETGESWSEITEVKTYAQFKDWLNEGNSFSYFYMDSEMQDHTVTITKDNFGDYKQRFCSELQGITVPPAENNPGNGD